MTARDRPPSQPAPALRSLRPDALACALLTALWILPLPVIGLAGDFPLNDDFAYAQATRTLLETGRFERSEWTFAPVVSNVALGFVFASLAGFSFEALRLSSVFMGWFGMLGAFLLSRQLGVAVGPSALGALVLAFNPLYLNLSYTFMTDVAFTALCVWSLLLFARGLENRSTASLAGGAAFALLALGSRQPGLALLPAAGAAWLLPRLARRGWLLTAGGLTLAGMIAVGLWAFAAPDPHAGSGSPDFSALAYLRRLLANPNLLQFAGANALTSFAYLGLFLTPVLGLLAPGGLRSRGLAVGVGLAAAGATAALVLAGRGMPLGFNVLYDLGLGPETLNGARLLPGAPAGFWVLVTFASLAGGLLASVFLVRAARRCLTGTSQPRTAALLLLAFPAVYLAPLLATLNFFDRYLLPALPCLATLLLTLPGDAGARSATRAGRVLALALLIPLAAFSVLATRDYLERNRVRWALLRPLVASGVPAERIDGGFELDGWSGINPRTRWAHRRAGEDRPEYVLSYLVLPEVRFRAVSRAGYRRWIPPRTEVITLYQNLRRAGEPR